MTKKERSIWHRRARNSLVTGRSSDYYNRVFDMPSDELILDLGSGKSPHAPENVVRLDYLFREYHPSDGNNVAALFQELPFGDETFDKVIASYSLIKVKQGAVRAISEILRVTRPGGYLQAFPVSVGSRAVARGIEANHDIERKQHVRRAERYGVPIVGGSGVGLEEYFESGAAVHGISSMASVIIGLASGTGIEAVGLTGYSFSLSIRRPELADESARVQLAQDIVHGYEITAAH